MNERELKRIIERDTIAGIQRETLSTINGGKLHLPVTEVRVKRVVFTITPETLLDYQNDFDTFTTWLKLDMAVNPAQLGQSAFQRVLLQNLSQNHPVPVKSGNLEGETTKSDKNWKVDYPYTQQFSIDNLQMDMELVAISEIKRELHSIEKFVLNNVLDLNFIKHFQTKNFSINITPSIIHWATGGES